MVQSTYSDSRFVVVEPDDPAYNQFDESDKFFGPKTIFVMDELSGEITCPVGCKAMADEIARLLNEACTMTATSTLIYPLLDFER